MINRFWLTLRQVNNQMMKKLLFTLLVCATLGILNVSASPDLTELLRGAAQAAQNRQNSQTTQTTETPAQNNTSATPDGTTGTSTQNQSTGSGSLGSLLQGLGGALGGGQGSSSGTNSQSQGSASSLLSGLSGLLNGLTSTDKLTVADLVGEWKYSQPAVTFQSDNLLQKAGGAAASGMINSKIAPYYQKVGMNNLEVTFSADSTFVFKLPRITATGTYSVAPEGSTGNFVFSFKALGKIPVGNMNAQVEKQINSMTITFDASKLIKLVDAVASITGQSTLKTVSQLLNSYDGLNCGFELKKIK